MKKYFNLIKLSAKWNQFHLADKCLIIIMVILMIQTAHNLFFHEIAMQDSGTIDVAIRTTTAGIFGYFISANFHSGNKNISKSNHKNTSSHDIATSSNISSHPKARIGFGTELGESELHSGYANSVKKSETEPRDDVQIVIIAAIGIVCLILLLIARNYSTINTASVATLSQLRDFISGSVGFLIGHSTQYEKSS